MTSPAAHSYEGQCRAVTAAGKRCRKHAEPGSSPELCDTHRRLRVSNGFVPMVPGWAVKERQHA